MPLWVSRTIGCETKRLIVKWYIVKFPIQSRGVCIPRQQAFDLARLLSRSNAWTKTEENKINEVVETLKDFTQEILD